MLRALFLVLALAAVATCAASSRSPPYVAVLPTGEVPQVVFRHASDACDPADIPDAPARAFRDEVGTVTFLATHWRNRRLRGDSLLTLRPDCAVVFEGAADARPEQFNDRLWIASTWTADGKTVHALVHSEYQGHRHPGQCPTGRYIDCWYNVISQAVSRDGGRSFRFEKMPPPIVAAVPYRYDRNAKRHVGFFSPTNILEHERAWYAMVFTEGAGEQRRGNCLLRTTRIAEPSAWRAWRGDGFNTAFADPYTDDPKPKQHLCSPLPTLNSPVKAVLRHEPSGAFIAVMARVRKEADGRQRSVVIASASWDLLKWSQPSIVVEVPYDCAGQAPVAYPSILDPRSGDRNFSTVGNSAMLFYTRFNLKDCRQTMNRDLLRLPVKILIREG